MGFPQRSTEEASSAVFVGQEARLLPGSYTCPRCRSRVPELPVECHTCGLTLISSPHLARSYHHLFPVQPYHEDSEVRACVEGRGRGVGGAWKRGLAVHGERSDQTTGSECRLPVETAGAYR